MTDIGIWEALTSSNPIYGENDVDACRRIFGGQKFTCRGYTCDKEIDWPGMCDDCIAKLERESLSDEQRYVNRLEALGVPSGATYCSWNEWKPLPKLDDESLEFNRKINDLMEWTGKPHTVLLAGPPGTGKTHAAVSIIRDFIEENPMKSVRFWTEFAFLEAVKHSFNGGDDVLQNALKNVDLLVFDDLGVVKATDWASATRAGLLNARIDNRKLTVITTNLGHTEISQTVDERLASRLRGAFIISTKPAEDLRREPW